MRGMIVIPAYNEEGKLGELIKKIRGQTDEPILVVDDGSRDRTGEVALKEGASVIRLKKNYGKGYALRKGFEYALRNNVKWIVTIDGDLQHDPKYIPELVKEGLRRDLDMVIASRFSYLKDMPRDRYLSNRLTTLVLSLIASKRLRDTQSGYRFIRTDFLNKIKLISRRFEMESELLVKLIKIGGKIGYVEVPVVYGDERSKINRFLDTIRFIKMVLKLLWA